MDGMVNEGELLLNVVKSDKPKTLIGLSQKASGQAERFSASFTQTKSHRRIDST
jgi:hypothetical protein